MNISKAKVQTNGGELRLIQQATAPATFRFHPRRKQSTRAPPITRSPT
jgi:hypothetical protein